MADKPKTARTKSFKESLSDVGVMIFGQGLAGRAGKDLKARPRAIDDALEDATLNRLRANQTSDSNN